MKNFKIIYTKTDEAPMLATHSLLPIIKSILQKANIEIELKDISLAGRILGEFSDYLSPQQKKDNDLDELGKLVKEKNANIIKLPNISASIPQIKAAIAELQSDGYAVPDFPEILDSDEQKKILAKYNKIKGSAVNPVLREGNSDRRAPKPVKQKAKSNPHSMGEWLVDSKTRIATMNDGDFRNNEKSITLSDSKNVRIVLENNDNEQIVLKDQILLLKGDIIDTSFLSRNKLISFLENQYQIAKDNNLLLSLHLKATMMKVSDPIIFGHAVRVYFKEIFDKYNQEFNKIGVEINNGLGNLLSNLTKLPVELHEKIKLEIDKTISSGPNLAIVNSEKGITNFHKPSDVIIDASIPAMIRAGGKMWNKDGNMQDTLAIIPDSSYAPIYKAVIQDCKKNGAYNPATMGSVSNVGLMAQKAEEYGSHDKTFEISQDGVVKVFDSANNLLSEHKVKKGDIWRMCITKDVAIQNWIQLAVDRARLSGTTGIFWLDKERSHDRQLIKKVAKYLPKIDTQDVELHIMSPYEACKVSVQRIRDGRDTISITGNVLRDYNTDLFPILELGTSAKMLSIVPLMNGGGLFETGAGGSAPKHVQQFVKENHLRWNSLGEFLALAASLEHYARSSDNPNAQILADTLDKATEKHLKENKEPTRKVNELDNRGSHFYIALYWAEQLAAHNSNTELSSKFQVLAENLAAAEDRIIQELTEVQGRSVDLDGYYSPNNAKVIKAMRPSKTFNQIIDNF